MRVMEIIADLPVDAAYADAVRRRLEIVHPLQDEDWGVRRSYVRTPDGTVVDLVRHRE